MGIPLYMKNCFSFSAFKVLCWFLTFENLFKCVSFKIYLYLAYLKFFRVLRSGYFAPSRLGRFSVIIYLEWFLLLSLSLLLWATIMHILFCMVMLGRKLDIRNEGRCG